MPLNIVAFKSLYKIQKFNLKLHYCIIHDYLEEQIEYIYLLYICTQINIRISMIYIYGVYQSLNYEFNVTLYINFILYITIWCNCLYIIYYQLLKKGQHQYSSKGKFKKLSNLQSCLSQLVFNICWTPEHRGSNTNE